MLQIISNILGLPAFFQNLNPPIQIAGALGKEFSNGLIFDSALTGWGCHLGQVTFTFQDALVLMAAFAFGLVGVIIAAKNTHWKPVAAGIGAAMTIFAAIDVGIFIFGTALNIFIQMIIWLGPTLAKIWFG